MTHTDEQDDEPQHSTATPQPPPPRSSLSSRSQQPCHAVVGVGWTPRPMAVILPHHPHIMLQALSTHARRTHSEATGITPSRRLPPI